MSPWPAVLSLAQRELVRFYRQPSRVVGALGTALLFWGILGAGLGALGGGGDYRVYFFPGTVVMSVMFSCIFCTASIIEDRQAGFLQSVLVAPLPRWAVVLGKVLGGATLAALQGVILLPFALVVGAVFEPMAFAGLLASLFLLAFTLTAMGFWLAWRIDSIPGFHTLMNLILLPLWMASGAVFPKGDPSWLSFLGRFDPFTYGVAGVRQGLFPQQTMQGLPSQGTCLVVLGAFSLLFLLLSCVLASRSPEGR